jgi:adenosine kinase
MSVMICGSLAFDTIMVFPERFKDHILPDKTHMLNVAFLVPELHRNFGGCAGNIAYTLKMLGGDPIPMASVGADFAPYREYLEKLGICQDYVSTMEAEWTAQAFITTDLDDNQITAFHPGAMAENRHQSIPTDRGITYGSISPDGKEAMLLHSAQFAQAGIPHLFDPGQGLPMFNGDELFEMINHATWLTLNSYEWEMLKEKTGLSRKTVIDHLAGGAIITHGADGSELITKEEEIRIEAVPPKAIIDPTGCGDAYRAGLLYGLDRGWEPVAAARLGSLLGSIKIAHSGPQHHDFSLDEIKAQYEAHFKVPMPD